MEYLMSVALIVAGVLLIAYSIAYLENHESNVATIKLRSFKKFYSINPDRWELNDSYVIFNVDFGLRGRERFQFSYFDEIAYRLWRIKQNRSKARVEKSKSMARMLKAVQVDIDKEKAKALDLQKDAIKSLEALLEDWNS